MKFKQIIKTCLKNLYSIILENLEEMEEVLDIHDMQN